MYEVAPTQGNRKSEVPLFKADIVLAIPNIIMMPGLDEIQQGLNTSIRLILSVSKSKFLVVVVYCSSKKIKTQKTVSVYFCEIPHSHSSRRLEILFCRKNSNIMECIEHNMALIHGGEKSFVCSACCDLKKISFKK